MKHATPQTTFFVLLAALLGVTFAAPVRADIFHDGATVCFYGDSITHGGRFHYYVYDYCVTRFPDRSITFINAGVAGDTAGAARNRMEEDVVRFRPDAVALMFGMNDVGRGHYVSDPTPAQVEAQNRAIEGYERNMAVTVGQLREKLDARLIFITPSPFDHTGVNDRNNNNPGCNDGLGRCAEAVRRLASETPESAVVDFHAPMTALNLERQKADPRFTIVGPDRVHPGGPGHLMMAWLFLRANDAPALVSNVVLDVSDGSVQAENATVSDFTKTPDGVRCVVREGALPFPVDPDARSVLELIPVVEQLNQETLAVRGLAPGTYVVKIDGAVVGEFSEVQLSAGVNLAMNELTPQYQQAQRVRVLGAERRGTDMVLRNFAAVRWFLRLRGVNPDDLAAVQDYYDHKMPSRTGYFESKVPGYLADWHTHEALDQKLAEQTTAMRAVAQPQEHVLEIGRK